MNAGAKVSRGMIKLCKVRSVGVNLKRIIYEIVVVPSVLYGAVAWALKERKTKRLDAMELKYLRSIWGLTRMDRFWSVEIRKRVGCNMSCRTECKLLAEVVWTCRKNG